MEYKIMSEPIRSFTWQILNIDDIVVYLKDGCKFIGQITGLDTKVKIRRLSPPNTLSNTFITPEGIQDYGEVSVSPDDVVGMIISKYNKDMMTKAFAQINNPVYKLELMKEFFIIN